MSLSAAEIEAVVRDLAPRIEGGKIDRIDQPDKHRVLLTIRKGNGCYRLLFVAHPRFSRLHLLTRRPGKPKPAAGFCNVLRHHITRSPVKSIRQLEGERVVVLELLRRSALPGPRPARLIAELIGTASNLILLDESDKILGAMFTVNAPERKVVPGVQYTPLPPPPPSAKALLNRFADVPIGSDDELALSRAIENLYQELEGRA